MVRKFIDIISLKTSFVSQNMMSFLCFIAAFLISFDCWAEENTCPSMEDLQKQYMNGCVPCQVVKVLLTAFMRASANVYDVSREAGTKLLLIGSAIWVAFWALKKVSSLTNPEPMAMLNELLVFFGKVLFAFVFINSGVGTLVGYAINPVIAAGADYGTALISAGASDMAHKVDLSSPPSAEDSYNGPTDIVSKKVMDKILRFSEAASYEVTNNLIIGSALSCFSVQAGIHWNFIIEFDIPDIWLWLCGAAIWVIGFLLTLAVCYYLVDIPFKLGFAIIALPVVIGLWPFKITQGKLRSVFMIAVNAAGTFLFLCLAVAYAMVLITNALQDKEALFAAFKEDNVTYVKDLFAITGSHFILILFCYVYGFKMIGQISDKMPDKFFGGSMTAAAGSPIHHMATAATNWLKQKAMAPVKLAGDIAAYQAGKAATTVAKAAGNIGLGAASYGVGLAGRGVSKGASFVGRKMANAGRAAQESYNAQQRMGGLQNTAATQLGLGVKSQLSGAFAQAGNLLNRVGKKGDELSKRLQTPLENTVTRMKDAAIESAKEVKAAASEFAIHNGWSQESFQREEELRGRFQQQEKERLVAQKEKSRDASRKVAAYVPNPGASLIESLGTALRKHEHTDSSNVLKKVAAKFAGTYGKHLERKGSFIKDIRSNADGGTHRNRMKKFFNQSLVTEGNKKQRTLGTAWNIVKSGFGSIAKGLNNADRELIRRERKDFDKVVKHAKILKNSWTEGGNNWIDSINSSTDRLEDSLSGLGNALKNIHKNFGTGADRIVDSTLENITNHSDINSQFSHLVKTEGKIIWENMDPFQNIVNEGEKTIDKYAHPDDNILESGLVFAAAITKGAVVGGIKDAANLALTTPVAATRLANMAAEGAYSATMHLAFAGIDAAKLATAPITSAVKTTADILGHTSASVLDFGKMTVSVTGIGQAVNIGAGVVNTVGAATKLVVKAPLRLVGGTVGFAAKTVDNTLYTAYRATVTPTLAVGNAALQGVKLGYRALSATSLGVEVRMEAHNIRSAFKVGLKTIKLGTNIIKAAAGEGSKRRARKLTPEEKARMKEEKEKKQRQEQQDREQREAAERQRAVDDFRRETEALQQQQNNLREAAREEFNRRMEEIRNEMTQRLSNAPANQRQQLRNQLMTEYNQRLSEIRNEILNRP